MTGKISVELVLRAEKASEELKKNLESAGKHASEKTKKSFGDAFRSVTKELSGTVDSVIGKIGAIGPGKAAMGVGVVLAVAAGIKILNDRIEKIYNIMKESSATFKGYKELQEKAFNLVMKPIGDMMATLMRPYLILMMARLRKGLQEAAPILKEVAAGVPGAQEKLMNVFKDVFSDMLVVKAMMDRVVAPIAGYVDSFTTALNVLLTDWTAGIGGWIKGIIGAGEKWTDIYKQAMNAAAIFQKVPADLKSELMLNLTKNPKPLEDLPGEIAAWVKSKIMSTPLPPPATGYDIKSMTEYAGSLTPPGGWITGGGKTTNNIDITVNQGTASGFGTAQDAAREIELALRTRV